MMNMVWENCARQYEGERHVMLELYGAKETELH